MRTVIIGIAIFVISMWGPSLKQAAALPIRLTAIYTPSANAHAFEALTGAIQRIKADASVNLKLTKEYRIDEVGAPALTLANFPSVLYYYWNARLGRNKGITLLFLGPLEALFFAGVASAICDPVHGFAIVNTDDSERRKTEAATIHEIGHLLGAKHHDRSAPNIMQTDFSGLPYDRLTFSRRSKRQIARCVK